MEETEQHGVQETREQASQVPKEHSQANKVDLVVKHHLAANQAWVVNNSAKEVSDHSVANQDLTNQDSDSQVSQVSETISEPRIPAEEDREEEEEEEEMPEEEATTCRTIMNGCIEPIWNIIKLVNINGGVDQV